MNSDEKRLRALELALGFHDQPSTQHLEAVLETARRFWEFLTDGSTRSSA